MFYFGMAYTVFSFLQYQMYSIVIYWFLDWSQPLQTLGVLVLVALTGVTIFLSIACLSKKLRTMPVSQELKKKSD